MRRSMGALVWVVVAVIATPAQAAEFVSTPQLVFVTSVTGTGNLSTWADAGGSTGIAAGDAVCRARAEAAGLSGSSTFVAWLSDSSTDAYCHVQQLSGKKAANCNLPSLPAAGGPWVRVDGFPFAGTLDEAMRPTGRILSPVWFDEYGAVTYGYYFTNTDASGVLSTRSASPCSNWTSNASALAEAGNPVRAGDGWTAELTANCNAAHPLLCVQTGWGSPLPPYRSGGALVFTTSVKGVGRMQSWPLSDGYSGLAGADHVCRNLATAAGLPAPSAFIAWLSTSTTDAVDRTSYDGPWIRIDGVKVADSKADLTDGILDAPINVDETGVYVATSQTWTGTTTSGTADSYHCSSWTSDASAVWGAEGDPANAHWGWTTTATDGCDAPDRIYCFATFPAVIFVDDLESAGTTAWSSTSSGP